MITMTDNWNYHTDFFKQADKNIVKNTTTEIFSEKLRNALSFKITGVENYVANLGAWGKLTWQICCNGIPVYPFDSQMSQIGQQGIPQKVQLDFIFPPASILSVQVINSDTVNDFTAGIVIVGEYGTTE